MIKHSQIYVCSYYVEYIEYIRHIEYTRSTNQTKDIASKSEMSTPIACAKLLWCM